MYAEETVLERVYWRLQSNAVIHICGEHQQIQLNISIDMDATCCNVSAFGMAMPEHRRTLCAMALLIGFPIFALHLEIQIILFARNVPSSSCVNVSLFDYNIGM